ncbi:hypothetical protein [Nitrosomonas communis]|uniref:Uncharacterized protein n=1 Tax=Nitrosomonas communis TaxID=44574 RepID=A0A1I4WRR2_9PROT|nr:hypothetical protein [Nitrosomonas communis]SFN16564.1 hypothetical protein SAMN05421863_11189 [Nitrosomonas communis]
MKFELSEQVKLFSGETGVLIGRAEYLDHSPEYLIRYKDSDGRTEEDWWKESDISKSQ